MSGPRDEDHHDERNGLTVALLEKAMERAVPVSIKVAGSSMVPLIRSGDVVVVSPVAGAHPKLGDVVALRGPRDESWLVHRVIARDAEGVILRGDNVGHRDGRFGEEDVIGMVTRVERRGEAVWFGAGRLGRFVAWAVRNGLVWRFNGVFYGTRRRARVCLKFALPDSRLPEHKGDDGNE